MEENEKEKTKSANPLLDEVKAEREKLEKARDEAKAQADRLEQLRSDQLLSGSAGLRPPTIETNPVEEKKRQAAEFFKGTEIEKAIKKHG